MDTLDEAIARLKATLPSLWGDDPVMGDRVRVVHSAPGAVRMVMRVFPLVISDESASNAVSPILARATELPINRILDAAAAT